MKKARLLKNRIHWMAACAAAGSTLFAISSSRADDIVYIGTTPGGAFDNSANWLGGNLPSDVDVGLLTSFSTVYDGTIVPEMTVGGLTASSGSFTQTGGTLHITTVKENNFGTSGGTSSFSLENNAHLEVTDTTDGWIFRIGSHSTATSFNMSGDAELVANYNGFFVLGDSTTLTGTMSDNAHIDFQSGYAFYMGDNATGVAEVTMSGHSSITSAASNFLIGSGGSGTLTLNENASIEIVSNETTVYTMKLGGGGSNVGSGTVVLNDNAKITGGKILLLDTGNDTNTAFASFEMNGSSTVNVEQVTIGHLAALGSTATVTVNAGATLTASDHITLGRDDATTGSAEATLNINGGTVATQYIDNGGVTDGSGAAHTVNIDGGTIRALAGTDTTATFFTYSQNSTAPVTVNIQEGGLIFDTNAFDVDISADMSGVGGLTKTGEGILTLSVASSYLGDTFLAQGELDLSTIYLSDTSKVTLANGTTLGLNFEGTDEIGFLTVDGVALDPGVYDSTNLGDYIAGTGSLTVTGVPEPSTLCLLGAGAMGFLFRSRRVRQRA